MSASHCRFIEFVPRKDPMVQRLLATREDVFPDYTRDGFRTSFASRYRFLDEVPIEGTQRMLFRLERRG